MCSFAQNNEMQSLSDIIEDIAEYSDEDLDYSSLYENLFIFYKDPLDLNKTDIEELEKLQFLTFFQVRSILNYRDKFDGFKSIYELQFVDGIDQQTLEYLLYFVTVAEKPGAKEVDMSKSLKYGRHVLFVRTQFTLQEKAGYITVPDSVLAVDPDKSRYLGSPYKLYTRYRFNYKDKMYWGITAEKDAGEEFFRGSQPYGFDYYSAHFQINKLGPVRTAIIGDYQVEFGQGLTLWSGMGFGKSSSPNNVIKKGRGITRYGSTNENEFLRGEAAAFKIGNFTITEFFSYKSIDASTDADSTYDDDEIVSSFLNTGYHRTPNEIATKDGIKELIAGGNVNYRGKWLAVGATVAAVKYSAPFTGNGRLYNLFSFSGTGMMNAGINYVSNFGKFSIFGETAISDNLALATLNGMSVIMAPEVSLSVLHRYYEPDYHAIYASPFSEGNKPSNESGFYIGSTIYPRKRWRIDLYADLWKYPWLRYGVDAPSDGQEYFAQINYSPYRNVDMFFRAKYETKQENNPITEYGVQDIIDYSSLKLRYQLSVSPGYGFQLKTRLEWNRYQQDVAEPENGFLLCQDVGYTFRKFPLDVTARVAVFNSETYNARFYVWEPDVLYAFSIPVYYDKGNQLLLLLKYSFGEHLDCWFKIANTFYWNKTSVSSGLEEIEGNKKTEVKFQIRYNF